MKTHQLFNQQLGHYLQKTYASLDTIPQERKERLEEISRFVANKIKNNKIAELTFICTHNSRRSHFAQVWAKVAALYCGFTDEYVLTYSGGTEVVACNPRTVAALQRAGIPVEEENDFSLSSSEANNPRYIVRLGEGIRPFHLYSKLYNDIANPQKDFCAVLVCSSADVGCPFVNGAEKRIYHGYEDPKISDNTPLELETYDLRCQQIATEMLYVFKKAMELSL